MMDYREALQIVTQQVLALKGHSVDVITIKRPRETQGAIELAKVISKLSPIIGNLLEYAVVGYLNAARQWPAGCRWLRQDPGFPDTVLTGMEEPSPGLEIKTWFPLATEITARFRDSQRAFAFNQTKVALLCWLPEYIIAGQPKIIDVWIGDAMEIAKARDNHYHNPPDYIVLEPEDTSQRARNLQQTNCNGLKFQGTNFQRKQWLWSSHGVKQDECTELIGSTKRACVTSRDDSPTGSTQTSPRWIELFCPVLRPSSHASLRQRILTAR